MTLNYVPRNFDSLDARIVQYKYAIVKLQRLLKSINDMLDQALGETPPLSLILIQYIIYLSATMFAINESGFNARLTSLEKFRALKPSNVTISQVVTHVAYDMKDQPIVPLEDLPSAQAALNCLKSFKAACANCLDGYQKRFLNALREISNEAYMGDLETIFTSVFFDQETDIDLTLTCSKIIPSFVLLLNLDKDSAMDPNFGDAALIDMDIYALFTLTLQMTSTLAKIKPFITKYREVKQIQKHLQDAAFQALPQSEYSFHRILFWALRLNDLYSIIRRFGRQIYIGNYEHLHDNKFISQMQNGVHFKTSVLKGIDEDFNTSKKNGILIATITRFIRMNSKYEVRPSTVLDFVGFIQQSFSYIEALNKRFLDFGLNWIAGELSFRKLHGLPVDHLNKLNDILQEEVARNLRLRRELTLQNEKAKAKYITKPTPKPAAKPAEKSTPTPPKLAFTRSSSVSSFNKSPSPSTEAPKKISSPIHGARRPLSMIFLHANSSATSFEAQSTSPIDKNKIVSTTSGGRRRSNSQPLSFNAAAAALKQPLSTSNSMENGLSSPSGSIRRTTSLVKKPLNATPLSPLASKMVLLKVVEETDCEPVTVKLTANQKFQQHLRDASKSGALFAQEKETLTNVLFDPNNPSATKLKRYIDAPRPQAPAPVEEKLRPKPQDVAESSARASLKKAQPLRPTVAQVTKLNTQRNSVSIHVSDSGSQSRVSADSVMSETSHNSDGSVLTAESSSPEEVILKKVRFTGVPEYTSAEDAPSTQSSRILRNFAAFKMPLINRASHAAFKKKDQMFKKEESILFKQQLHPGENNILTTASPAGSYVPMQQPLRLSKFRP